MPDPDTRAVAIREHLAARTPGVWCDAPNLDIGGWSVYVGVGEGSREVASFVRAADAALIARAPSWLLDLLADNERLTAELADANTEIVRLSDDHRRYVRQSYGLDEETPDVQ